MSKKNKTLPIFDLDIHKSNTFLYYFLQTYLQNVYESLSEIKPSISGKTILDIGIGRGRALSIYKNLNVKKVIGIDISQKEVYYAIRKAKHLDLKLDIIVDDANNKYLESLNDNSFEVISIMYTLFCLPSDEMRQNIIGQIKRILKPNGLLIVLDSQKYSLMSYLNSIINTRKFITKKEMIDIFKPLELVSWNECNHFYFFNKPIDILGKFFGLGIYRILDTFSRLLRIPGSMVVLVFRK